MRNMGSIIAATRQQAAIKRQQPQGSWVTHHYRRHGSDLWLEPAVEKVPGPCLPLGSFAGVLAVAPIAHKGSIFGPAPWQVVCF